MNKGLILGVLMVVVLVGGVIGTGPGAYPGSGNAFVGGTTETSGSTSATTTPTPSNGEKNYGEYFGFESDNDVVVTNGIPVDNLPNEMNGVTFDEAGGSLRYNHEGEETPRAYENIGEDSSFAFKDGEMIRATIDAYEGGNYRLGDYEVDVPEGSRIIYIKADKDSEKDTLTILQPTGSEIGTPKFIGQDEKKDIDISYELKRGDEDGFLTLNGNKIKRFKEYDFNLIE